MNVFESMRLHKKDAHGIRLGRGQLNKESGKKYCSLLPILLFSLTERIWHMRESSEAVSFLL